MIYNHAQSLANFTDNFTYKKIFEYFSHILIFILYDLCYGFCFTVRLKSVDTLIINKVTLWTRIFGYTEENGMEVYKEYTPLVIACM